MLAPTYTRDFYDKGTNYALKGIPIPRKASVSCNSSDSGVQYANGSTCNDRSSSRQLCHSGNRRKVSGGDGTSGATTAEAVRSKEMTVFMREYLLLKLVVDKVRKFSETFTNSPAQAGARVSLDRVSKAYPLCGWAFFFCQMSHLTTINLNSYLSEQVRAVLSRPI